MDNLNVSFMSATLFGKHRILVEEKFEGLDQLSFHLIYKKNSTQNVFYLRNMFA